MTQHSLSLLFALLLAWISAPAVATTTELPFNKPSGTQVLRAEFGLFNLSQSGKPPFVPAKVVPLKPNQSYGWLIQLRTDKPKIRWKEEFTLPAKPNTWGDPEPIGARTVSSDGRVSVTEREVAPDRGTIFNVWTVAPGDPKGRYRIRVYVEGSLAQEFEFDVQ